MIFFMLFGGNHPLLIKSFMALNISGSMRIVRTMSVKVTRPTSLLLATTGSFLIFFLKHHSRRVDNVHVWGADYEFRRHDFSNLGFFGVL